MPLWAPPSYRNDPVDMTAKGSSVTVTASATPHTLGSYASLLDPVTCPIYALGVRVSGLGTTNANTSALLNIAIGPTGGGNENVIIPNLDVSAAFNISTVSGKAWLLPCLIPAGVRISANLQGVVVSETASVNIAPVNAPFLMYHATRWYAYGANTAVSGGTSVTTGSGSFGSWTQVGTSSATIPHSLWTCGYDFLTDTSHSAGVVRIEIGYGPDSSNVVLIGGFDFYIPDTTEQCGGPWPDWPVYSPVPVSTALWARINGTSAEARGVIIYGA